MVEVRIEDYYRGSVVCFATLAESKNSHYFVGDFGKNQIEFCISVL